MCVKAPDLSLHCVALPSEREFAPPGRRRIEGAHAKTAMNRNAQTESLAQRADLQTYAESVLGARCWSLPSAYGRVMSGPDTGLYVSGLPAATARGLVDALIRGERIHVHLMHRHRTRCYESLSLRLDAGQLTMVFKDREHVA